jgi:hypothetical protein
MISNDTTVNSVEDSRVTTILAVGGNHTTVLGYINKKGIEHNDSKRIR